MSGCLSGDNESSQRETLLAYCGFSPVSLSFYPGSLGYGHKPHTEQEGPRSPALAPVYNEG